MKYLDIDGVRASAVALGCMRLAGKPQKEADRLLDTAINEGINWFDHADIYGGGLSEEIFGAWLASRPGLRDRVTVQTKCGIGKGCYDFSREHIVAAVEGSLRRLGTDHVDVLLLHRPDTLMEPEEVAAAFDRLEKDGKVLRFGVSNHNAWQMDLLRTAVCQPLLIDQLQVSLTEAGLFTSGMNVNMQNVDSVMHDGGLLEQCRIRHVTIQAWSPLQYGFFAGNFVGDREKFPALNDKLDELAEAHRVSSSAVSVAWLLRHPAGIQAIVGTMSPEHLAAVAAAGDVTLSRAEWYDLYRAAGHCLP